MLELILGAMDELKLGDPFLLDTDVGPVIDENARKGLEEHAVRMTKEAKLLRKLNLGPEPASPVGSTNTVPQSASSK